jgi:hypothetical protein
VVVLKSIFFFFIGWMLHLYLRLLLGDYVDVRVGTSATGVNLGWEEYLWPNLPFWWDSFIGMEIDLERSIKEIGYRYVLVVSQALEWLVAHIHSTWNCIEQVATKYLIS